MRLFVIYALCGLVLACAQDEGNRVLSVSGSKTHADSNIDFQNPVTAQDQTPTSQNGIAKVATADAATFSLIVIPDAQSMTDATRADDRLPYFASQTRWIAENIEKENIAFVLFEGDLTEHNTEVEWERAYQCIQTLDDAGVKYSVAAPGNHDMVHTPPASIKTRDTSLFNTYFPASRYTNLSYFGGSYEPGKTENSYYFFSAGGEDYMVVALEFAPRLEVLNWAGQKVDFYSKRKPIKVIVVTHSYMKSDNSRVKKNEPYSSQYTYPALPDAHEGDEIWNLFVKKYSNIFLVLSGHFTGDGLGRLISTRTDGSKVYQLLVNYQREASNGNDGHLRIMKFVPSENKIVVSDYSPHLGSYHSGTQSEFIIDLKNSAFSSLPAVADRPVDNQSPVNTNNATDITSQYTASTRAQLRSAYCSILGGEPDAAGFAWWLEQITTGARPIDNVKEAFKAAAANPQKAYRKPCTPASIEDLNQVYLAVRGRPVDKVGSDFWIALLHANLRTIEDIQDYLCQTISASDTTPITCEH